MKTIVTTYPFGHTDNTPIKMLQSNGFIYTLNEVKRKYTRLEHLKVLAEEQPDIIIAGTELYDKVALDVSNNLKLISRVGIGIDGIDLNYCKEKGITVTNTPDAPTNAVAELTILQMLNMLRKVQNVSYDMFVNDKWNRYIGRELKDCVVGIIGMGRVGASVWKKIKGFEPKQILVHDINHYVVDRLFLMNSTLQEILTTADIITIHIPLNDGKVDNTNFISMKELDMMKNDVRLLNMSRGGIINEKDLYNWLLCKPKATVAIDTFIKEPYKGELDEIGSVYLTPHLGSCTTRARHDMECGAVDNAILFLNNSYIKDKVV